MRNTESIVFAGGTIDRAAHLRGDPKAIFAFISAPSSKAILLWRGKLLTDTKNHAKLAWLDLDENVLELACQPPIFLGLENGAARFAYDISAWEPAGNAPQKSGFLDVEQEQHPSLPAHLKFTDLRAMMGELSDQDAGNAATAKGIFEWHVSHGFCANCGAQSLVSKSGWQRHCPACNRQHFPRTDPVVIMLVTHGNDVLLGRAPVWPEGMFSLLAGFMEPGETITEAVRREVFEETSVQVGAVEYLADQPWPFPASLMIGCRAQALSRDIVLDPVELESALWLSREEVMASMDGKNPTIQQSRHGSISRFLLDHWLNDTLD